MQNGRREGEGFPTGLGSPGAASGRRVPRSFRGSTLETEGGRGPGVLGRR